MEYSIVIPVFNKAELTRNCLTTLAPTLEGAGDGEVIVVDNASNDETPAVLAQFPWARVVRNERNRGFAAANNQGAALASGRVLVLLNNDTQPFPGWLHALLEALADPAVGIAGARLLYPNKTIQHAGVVVNGLFFSRASFLPWHFALGAAADDPSVTAARDFQMVTAACMATPRALYGELGGLDEGYWNGYEDVDYCLRVGERGLRVVYEPRATLYHFESQSGTQRFRQVSSNVKRLGERWHGRVRYDAVSTFVARGAIRRMAREARGTFTMQVGRTPPTTLIVHGGGDPVLEVFEAALRDNVSPIDEIVWCGPANAIESARDAMAVRGDRYLAFVRADGRLEPGWLDELVAQIEALPNVAAATFAPELPAGENVRPIAAGARCTLLSLRQFPQHLALRDFNSLDAAVADLLLRALELGRGTRGASRPLGVLGAAATSQTFDPDPARIEEVLRARQPRGRGLVSIVTLSWNAPDFTKKALESIRAATSEPYEVIVVDNGSQAPTHEMLAAIDDPHVRVIYNERNLGYAGGNNVGIAAAGGEYVVLLNNDVVVVDGWLDGLLDPFIRIPGLGVTAPRSNLVAGHQQLPDAIYQTEPEMIAFAAARREAWAGTGYFSDRAIGLCLCVDRVVFEQIGGLDERFGLGNFEDDDFCIRVRAAGYGIYICDDVFIHHFGSRSFAANNVDYTKSMHENWGKFAAKWGFAPQFPTNGYQPAAAFNRGFDRNAHFVPLPSGTAAVAPAEARGPEAQPDPAIAIDAATAFYAVVDGEERWKETAQFVKRFARAFRVADDVVLAIAALGEPSAETIAGRVRRILTRVGVSEEQSANVEISDEDDAVQWRASFASSRVYDVASLNDRSPSGLRRLAGGNS